MLVVTMTAHICLATFYPSSGGAEAKRLSKVAPIWRSLGNMLWSGDTDEDVSASATSAPSEQQHVSTSRFEDHLPSELVHEIARHALGGLAAAEMRPLSRKFRDEVSASEVNRLRSWKNSPITARWPEGIRQWLDEETGEPSFDRIEQATADNPHAAVEIPVWLKITVGNETVKREAGELAAELQKFDMLMQKLWKENRKIDRKERKILESALLFVLSSRITFRWSSKWLQENLIRDPWRAIDENFNRFLYVFKLVSAALSSHTLNSHLVDLFDSRMSDNEYFHQVHMLRTKLEKFKHLTFMAGKDLDAQPDNIKNQSIRTEYNYSTRRIEYVDVLVLPNLPHAAYPGAEGTQVRGTLVTHGGDKQHLYGEFRDSQTGLTYGPIAIYRGAVTPDSGITGLREAHDEATLTLLERQSLRNVRQLQADIDALFGRAIMYTPRLSRGTDLSSTTDSYFDLQANVRTVGVAVPRAVDDI